MTDTIEAFVTKLKSEGVEEGKRQAEQLRGNAQQQAEQIVADAKSKAEKIIADANAEADSILVRSRTEMELAARDATLKLRDSLGTALQSVLTGPVESQLTDSEFLKELIQSIVSRYLEAEIESYAPMKISVSPEMHQKLADWAVTKLRIAAIDDTAGIDVQGTLRQAGFEFSLHGATIEITKDSVVDTLMQLVGPSLREILSQAGSKD